MAKRMLIDAAHPEETRVVVLSGSRLEEFDFETSTKKQIKGNIYLAKVTRVEPSLQAAFVEYGGNRHGFLAFNEIHPDYYRIPVADREAALEAEREAEAAANAREEDYPERDPPPRAEPDAEDRLSDPSEADEPDELRLADLAPPDTVRESMPGLDAPREEPDPADRAPSWVASPRSESPPEDGEDEDEEPGSEELGAEDAADHAAILAEAAPEPQLEAHHNIETVGGDELEEAARPRARPYRHYKIQEVIKRRQIMLVQVTKEERGNKGAALTTYLSLAGRYCVLMPNTPRGGGVSRKITNNNDRRRLKDLMSDLEVPDGMGVIVRTAGSERSKAEIKRDFEYLLRLWDEIRELTLKSTAPALIYEEGNLIKRSIRDLYARDIDEVVVDGEEGYRTAKTFMKMLMPSHAKRVKLYRDPSVSLFYRHQVEPQIDAIHSPVVQLRSGGYIVMNPTEALVAIDVNSGRSTKERNIEETALKTNIEAADEIARQLRLRDLAGLVVIDFIDMEEYRNRSAVERRLKEAMRHDRARIQLGRISPFGLLELSRQRLRPSLVEASTQPCPYCNGSGHIRSIESTALHVLRAIEEEGMRRRSAEITLAAPTKVALYVLNQKRAALRLVETHFGMTVAFTNDDSLVPPAFRLDRGRALTPQEIAALPTPAAEPPVIEEDEDLPEEEEEEETIAEAEAESEAEGEDAMEAAPQPREERAPREHAPHERERAPAQAHSAEERNRRRRRRGRRDEQRDRREARPPAAPAAEHEHQHEHEHEHEHDPDRDEHGVPSPRAAEGGERQGDGGSDGERRRRRGRRGGRRRRRDGQPGQRPGEHAPHPAFEHTADAEYAPEAEQVELVPPERGHDEAVREVAAAFTAPPAPPEGESGSDSVPVADHAAPHEAPSRAAEHYNVPPPQDVNGPPAKPRKGWWRR